MNGPGKLLSLPDDCWTIAFRGIEAVLREDPTLADPANVKTWRSRQGSADDLAVPGAGEFPLASLSPVPRADQILDTSSAKANFLVSVELFVLGSCADDLLNLWGAFVRAVHPNKPHRGGSVKDFLSCGLPPAPPLLGSTTPIKVSVFGLIATDPAFLPVSLGSGKSRDNTAVYQRGLGFLACHFQRPA